MHKAINPNSDKDFINKLDLSTEKKFPSFLQTLEFKPFRHIPDLTVNFKHPISVISGTNRSGKSTILMALACSHFEFKKRNIHNGVLERQTWSSIMQFTKQDQQTEDWTYYITCKTGKKIERKRGQRKANTKKWNGIGKKESQFKNRQVTFLDLDRISPARNYGRVIFSKTKYASLTDITHSNTKKIEQYLSYVLEEEFLLKKITSHLDKDIFKYNNTYEYSSYNAATGEEVLTKMIIDIVEAPDKSLILIDEIEVGLHPKIQRKLIDVLYNIARNEHKQFIITSHSPSILSSLPEQSRIFLEQGVSGLKAIQNISVNAALSKMDSLSYPLVDLYCEDEEALKILNKAVSSIQTEHRLSGFKSLINIIVSGSANKTYQHYLSHKETIEFKRVKTGYACVLDGDQKLNTSKNGSPQFPPSETLHFLYSDYSPEKFLVESYLKLSPNKPLKFHFNNSAPHCLFEKMMEQSLCTSRQEAFDICWNAFTSSPEGSAYFAELKEFLLNMATKYSPDL